ncbi:LuxR C-terminal-related transcriptional regulator [uncultured Muribaculum sp.]|uniref:LuxR C-terminal-related transcriptional regulator n=1 Tax=uncultured Muribaculum sp. TaxID=1918613 RepID=UPI0025B7419B|nr:LuxR C-terminal-related transcriptional regulator [uncultured Muribaculum sp.]
MTLLINDNSLLLMVMSRFGISLGFGDKTVEAVCSEQNVDCETFLAVCNFISFQNVNGNTVSIEPLIEYLKKAHSYFLDFNMPLIRRKLIEAIDCSGRDQVAMLILKFYDAYTEEVRRHMDYEDKDVFTYIDTLLSGKYTEGYSIDVFASGHHQINTKLKELKDIIIRYLPQRENNLLNAVLFDIINCEQDLVSHCKVEDTLLVPAVRELEARMAENLSMVDDTVATNGSVSADMLSNREKEIIAHVARGMSNKGIADKLFLSVHTVTTHRRNISNKLQIHSPAGLAIYAVVNGLVNIDDLEPV